ncbi:MAG: amidase [Rhodospirillales bacterium]|nr:amidase [Rhodospirillales bacterium]
MTEWWRKTATGIAASIAAGETTAEEVMASHLARADAVNPKLNAITVRHDDEAMAEARAADARQQAGEALGPLHGVPVTIKENVDQKGHATTNGVEAFVKVVADDDSPVVANLRKAGAIPMGRTNTPEFSLRYFTDNTLRGQTLNPWNKDVTPGGSSGGASSACAAGMGPIAHGNDLGGSIRYPAYACGLVGIRPTLGRVPAYNPTQTEERPPTLQLMSVQGPHTRNVADCRLALAAMAQRDPRDPWWVPAPLEGSAMHTTPRAAICTDPGGIGVDPKVADAVRTAGDALSNAGYKVTEIKLPALMESARLWMALLMAEIDELMEPAIREYGSAKINGVLDNYQAAQNQFFGNDRPGSNRQDYMRNVARRAGDLRNWSMLMEEHGVIVGPVSTEPPFEQNADEKGVQRTCEIFMANRLTYAVNMLGLPSCAAPTGASDGVTMGVQIIAPRYREDMAFDAAQAVEDACGVMTPIDPAW